jgi:SAM-dependent methyltransferase
VDAAREFQFYVYRHAVAEVGSRSVSSIVDVGSGPPHKLAQLLSPTDISVTLVDQPNAEAIAREIMPFANFIAANLEAIDMVLPHQFDVAICADVVEHLVGPDPCLRFIRKHLKPGGRLFISTPERDVLRGVNCFESPHPLHVREWNRPEFAKFLESRGFKVLDQILLPQKRVPEMKRRWGALMAGFNAPPSWYSCQMAVCAVA